MPTHFFNNTPDNSLFAKLSDIARQMHCLDSFLAVTGYFRSSGYFRLRREMKDVPHIRILVGIDVDSRTIEGLSLAEQTIRAKQEFGNDYRADVAGNYDADVEEGLLQMVDDIASGVLEMRIHRSRNIHAKFYLCLPAQHTESSDGWVIMGSSNLTAPGLGLTNDRYELNVALKDYDDVHYCHEEFQRLWAEGDPITEQELKNFKDSTYLGVQLTPYELFLRVLIEAFGPEVETDFTTDVTQYGIMDLSYQRDAAVQGYRMLERHGGFYLADVVGLGKTIVATIVVRRLIEMNPGIHVLVVAPNAILPGWQSTFERFKITSRNARYITNGSLDKVIAGKNYLFTPDDIDLVVVDEAHNFRNDGSEMFTLLEQITKTAVMRNGRPRRKKVILLSATPMNNRPADLLNQLLLFEDGRRSTIEGVPDLKGFFTERQKQFERLMKDRGLATTDKEREQLDKEVRELFDEIRTRVIDKITIRRTRHNILNSAEYKKDLALNGVVFPNIADPRPLCYELGTLGDLFCRTIDIITDKQQVSFARYAVFDYLAPKKLNELKKARQNFENLLNGIFRTHMVKRLESSFAAFLISLDRIILGIDAMLRMWSEDKIVVMRNIVERLDRGDDLDDIIARAEDDEDIITLHRSDFRNDKDWPDALLADRKVFVSLKDEWSRVLGATVIKATKKDEEDRVILKLDPKFDELERRLPQMYDKKENAADRMVVFTESKATMRYLEAKFNALPDFEGRVLAVSANEYTSEMEKKIRANFDANYEGEQANDYRLLITTDVLAEGVNLHRANVILSYDTPWNATSLMQRVGRVNRIGSKAACVYSYMCYPSQNGDSIINLKMNAFIKLQGFHHTFGEDARIFSPDETVRQFHMFVEGGPDVVDTRIRLLRLVRELYQTDHKQYLRLRQLPDNCRVLRSSAAIQQTNAEAMQRAGLGDFRVGTVGYLKAGDRAEFYAVTDGRAERVDFYQAVALLEARPEEQPLPGRMPKSHYSDVRQARATFRETLLPAPAITLSLSQSEKTALKHLRDAETAFASRGDILDYTARLRPAVTLFSGLVRALNGFFKTFDYGDALAATSAAERLASLAETYSVVNRADDSASEPEIVITETIV